MSDHVVVGTAGHVDHGKTALVRALTGVETDRWEEEKRRGITIDLGFAQLDLGGGRWASVVDVPGHEDFVRNMVAGATGIDLALLVIAADEGIMPQTDEHLAILQFLGVHRGVIAIAKTDLVEPDWLDLVTNDVRERMVRSAIAWEAVVPVSAVTGEGLDTLRAALSEAARHVDGRDADDLFRLPVDRVFTVAGTGTVATGTVWSGTASVGDEVLILPGASRARVRNVEVHGRRAERAVPGRRTAVALAGVDRSALGRGSWVVMDAGWRLTDRLDVRASVLPDAPAVTQRTRVRVHLGTAEVLARTTPLASRLEPGATGLIRLRLEQPVVARWGDRIVLRSYSPVTTVGGAVVLDPWPAPRPRRPVGAEALDAPLPDRVIALCRRAGRSGVPLRDLPVRAGVAPNALQGTIDAVVSGGEAAPVEGVLVATQALQEARHRLVRALEAFHQREPLAPGLSREALRRHVVDSRVASWAEAALAADGTVVLDDAVARLSTHDPRPDATQARKVEQLGNALEAAGFEGKTADELASALEGSSDELKRLAEYSVRQGTAVRVGRERYYDRRALERMVALAAETVERHGQATPAQFRESLGLTRKFLIPFLEWLDQEGYTVRSGDVRRPGARLTKGS